MRKLVLPMVAVLVLLLWAEPVLLRRNSPPPAAPVAKAEPATRPLLSDAAAVRRSERRAQTKPTSQQTLASAEVSSTRPLATATTTGPDTLAAKPANPIPANPEPAKLISRSQPEKPKATPAAKLPPLGERIGDPNLDLASIPPAEPMAFSSFTWLKLRGNEGFWRIGRNAQGVWWFISPENTVEFLNTVTTVQPYQLARDPQGTIFLSRDYEGTPTQPGDLRKWAERTLTRVKAAGFKGLGAWCHPIFHELDVPMTRDLNIWAHAPAESPRLYDPGWLPAAEAVVKALVVKFKDNRNLVGYYLDNELDFSDARLGPGVYFDNLPADNPNRVEVMKVIRKLWPDISSFNVAWGFAFKSYDDLNALKSLPKDPPETYAYLLSAWLEHLMRDYFDRTTVLVRKYDPNHLILGIRYAGFAPAEVIRASREFTDAQSINYYVSDALLDPQLFNNLRDLGDQPLILSEYAFHALDGRSGNRNASGFQGQVMDQKARADAYRIFTTRLAKLPWVIGADWFQWSDEPPSGRAGDGEDVNFGIVDVDDREYGHMVEAIRETAPRLNTVHKVSHTAEDRNAWRDSFAVLPTQRVPYLPIPIRLNGELSDWPATAKLRNLNLTKTIGLDRSVLPPPNVYLGWRPEGLYMGIEVFDTDPVAAPIAGRWWTRDIVEMWVSTRPVSSDQTGYNQYCHQLLFLPSDGSMNNGISGAAGQYHRPGDALTDNLMPHPDIKFNCRILSDRYVVEMLIPGSALKGWDPGEHPQIAFNVHVRNYQHAVEYFWSSPKEVQTQHRPKTWGTLHLESAPTPDDKRQVDSHDNTASPAVAKPVS